MFSEWRTYPVEILRLLVSVFIGLMTSSFLVAPALAEELPSLERALLQQSPKILEFARKQGYHNIGVLKFRIREGDNGTPSDHNGLLNRNLAERLELALILKNRPMAPVGIIHDASRVAAKIPGASHLNAVGRAKLFSVAYALAWGTEAVNSDAFLTGAVQISSDYKKAMVGISAFGRNDSKLQDVVRFSASLSANDLVEVGASFTTRSVFGGGEIQLSAEQREAKVLEAASNHAALIRTNPVKHPLNDPSAPIRLVVHYDGKPVALEFRDRGAFVKEPAERQKVAFVLHRTNPADQTRYAVVLRLNGENTLRRERVKDIDCTKWILEPGAAPITVEGFQLDERQRLQFQVLSRQASQAKEMDYGADVGTISLVVFQEQSATTPAIAQDLLDEEAEDFAILSRGTFPAKQPESLEALKSQLAHSSLGRGLITEGRTETGAIRKVNFNADPLPVMAATITYYSK